MRTLCVLSCLLAAAAIAAPDDVHTFEMTWQKDGFNMNIRADFDRDEPFASEPNTQDRTVYRGVFEIGPEKGKEKVGFLWDQSEQKLYVDINRDGDLTNDPNGQLANAVQASHFQEFNNLDLSFQNESGIFQYTLDVSIYDYYRWADFTVRSGYGGTCELKGKNWTFQASDVMNAAVRQGNQFTVFSNGLKNRISQADLPESVFLDGGLYDLSFEFKKAGDGFARLWCTLKERQAATGTLQIKGQWIDRLVLGDVKILILPDITDQPMVVPVGEFDVKQFALKYSDEKPTVYINRIEKTVSVREGQLSELSIGGPFKSSVEVRRQGRMLDFSFKLTGAGGESYNPDQVTRYDRTKKPAVAIYKGEMQLASGEFEFG